MHPTRIRMAGHNHGALAMDPALVKYNSMSANRYKYFRWTARTGWLSFLYIAVIPGALGYVGYVTDGKWQFRGKLRGDVIKEW